MSLTSDIEKFVQASDPQFQEWARLQIEARHLSLELERLRLQYKAKTRHAQLSPVKKR